MADIANSTSLDAECQLRVPVDASLPIPLLLQALSTLNIPIYPLFVFPRCDSCLHIMVAIGVVA
jgi:hypothetical protein